MEQFLIGLDNSLVYLYSLVMLAGFIKFKELNSINLTAALFIMFIAVFTSFRDPFFEWVLTQSKDIGRASWYGVWMLSQLLVSYAVLQSHRFLGLTMSSEIRRVNQSLYVLAGVYLFGYIESYLISLEITNILYRFSIPAISLGAGVLMLLGVIRQDAKQVVISKATHNRAVKWHQDIINLPASERLGELEKWNDYVKDLPTDKPFGK